VPDHSTFDRFVHQYEDSINDLFFQIVNSLDSLGGLNKDVVYQDGTNIESKAGRDTFTRKKATQKSLEKFKKHIIKLISDIKLQFLWELKSDTHEASLEEIILKLSKLN